METAVGFRHELPENLLVDESYKVSYEAFADIVFDILDIHLIEPISHLVYVAKVVPRKKELVKSRVRNIDSYMKKLEKNLNKQKVVDPNQGNITHFMHP